MWLKTSSFSKFTHCRAPRTSTGRIIARAWMFTLFILTCYSPQHGQLSVATTSTVGKGNKINKRRVHGHDAALLLLKTHTGHSMKANLSTCSSQVVFFFFGQDHCNPHNCLISNGKPCLFFFK